MAANTRNAYVRAALKRGQLLLHANHCEDADAIFARSLEQDARQAEALIGRARAALNKGASADAASFLRSVLADQRGHAEAWFARAVVT